MLYQAVWGDYRSRGPVRYGRLVGTILQAIYPECSLIYISKMQSGFHLLQATIFNFTNKKSLTFSEVFCIGRRLENRSVKTSSAATQRMRFQFQNLYMKPKSSGILALSF